MARLDAAIYGLWQFRDDCHVQAWRDGGRDSGAEVAVAVHHPADAAADSEMRELDVTSAAMFEERLRMVEDALRRIDDGTYGTCIACGRPIIAERLELVPETPYCVEDAAKANG